jgi:membrane fusion protein, multidrug efflux system
VIFTLPQDQLRAIMRAMAAAPLKAIASTSAGERLGEGTVALVDNQIDQQTGTIKLKATFPNADHALWPGQFVSVRLLLRTLPQIVTVPSTAVQRGPDGMYVYVVKPDSTIAMHPVSVIQMADGISAIQKGLAPGTRIVVSGQYRLQPGSRVRANVADADRSGP